MDAILQLPSNYSLKYMQVTNSEDGKPLVALDPLDHGGGSVTALACCMRGFCLDAFVEKICFLFS